MARPIATRVTYDRDVRAILKLKESVERDCVDIEFIIAVSALVSQLAQVLIVGPKKAA